MSRDIIEAIARKQLEIAGVPAAAKNPDGRWLRTSMNGLVEYLNAARALGYELVPQEPSKEMLMAATPAMSEINQIIGYHSLRDGSDINWPENKPPLHHAYKAMVSVGRIAID